MANLKISDLTAAVSANGTQLFEVSDSGTTYKLTGAQLLAYIQGNLTLSNISDVTATAAELNKLDGMTATTLELNYVDGVTSAIQTQLDSKAAASGGTITSPTITTPVITSPDIDLGSDATGDILYRDSGGSIARLGIGSTDQVLKVASGLPSWGDAGGGGSLEFIATADASNSSGLVFTGFDSASYDSYRFILGNVVPASDGANLRLSMSSNGGSSYVTWFEIAGLVGSGAGEYGVSGELEIYFPHILRDTWVNATTMYEANDGNEATVTTRERWYAATWGAINTVRFNYSSGNVESGTVTMYGYKNA